MVPPEPDRRGRLVALGLWVLLCFVASGVGAAFMPGAWYQSLVKPPWNPPGWIFGPVWTVLYTLMGVASWKVWCRGGFTAQRHALTLFLVQLVLNAAWTPLFFGLKRLDLAFVEIVVLWCVILATVRAFWRADRTAGVLLVPYLLWVTFAAVLNGTLWQLNS